MKDVLNQYIFHWTQDRAIFISGHTLSWDARCAGIYIGYGIGVLYYAFSAKKAINLPRWPILIFITLLFLPLFLDVFSLKIGLRCPSNDVKYFTGLLFGYALSVYVCPAIVRLSCCDYAPGSSINSFGKLSIPLTIIGVVFILKDWDLIISYFILQSLAYFGFLCLFIGFGLSLLGILRKS